MTGLVRYEAARKALAEAHSVDEVKTIRDQAEAMRAYARQAKDVEFFNWAAEIKLRAERKAGELLAAMEKAKGVRLDGKTEGGDVRRSHRATAETLSDLGVNKGQSSRWQKVASVPEEKFEGYIRETLDSGKELTSAGVRKLASAEKHDKRKSDECERNRTAMAGDVRLILGNARTHVFDDDSIDLLLTDPPYSTDVDDMESFVKWMDGWLPKVKTTGRAYIFVGAYPDELRHYLTYLDRRGNYGMTLDEILVWTYRNTLGPSPKQGYKLNWQACLYLYGPDAPPLDCPVMTEQFSVQDINAPDARTGVRWHAWQKPDEIAERFIRHSTREGQLVVDPFCGTGTFVAAASRLGRRAIGIDNSEEMLDICRRRGLEVADAA